jgi:preprotein translocase subunit SecG
MTLGQWLMLFAILVICVLLIGVILIQRGRGGGLSAAFGGGGSGSAFGAKTGDVFTAITVVLTAFFLLSCVVGNYIFLPEGFDEVRAAGTAPTGQQPSPSQQQQGTQRPAPSGAPVPAPQPTPTAPPQGAQTPQPTPVPQPAEVPPSDDSAATEDTDMAPPPGSELDDSQEADGTP